MTRPRASSPRSNATVARTGCPVSRTAHPEATVRARASVPVPDRIAARLAGREFASFDAFRAAFWREVAADPALAGQFTVQNVGRMRAGYAPISPPSGQLGGRNSFELDHIEPLFRGGAVYDIDNLQIMTPRAHIEKTGND